MSIVICERCDAAIDSDFDQDCFCEPPTGMCTPAQQLALTTVLCEPCREKAWDRQQEEMASEPPPSLQEQYEAAFALKQSLKR